MKVLLVESHAGSGATDARRLEAAGHSVARCFPERWNSEGRRTPFVCTAISEGICPIEAGVDVALVVRPSVSPRPTGLEAGALCALRQGIPLVEHGPAHFDPYEPWLSARATDDVVRACERGSEVYFDTLRHEIRARIGPILQSAGIEADDLEFRFETHDRVLNVSIHGPAVTRDVEQRLAVRAAEAVRTMQREFDEKNFSYEVNAR